MNHAPRFFGERNQTGGDFLLAYFKSSCGSEVDVGGRRAY